MSSTPRESSANKFGRFHSLYEDGLKKQERLEIRQQQREARNSFMPRLSATKYNLSMRQMLHFDSRSVFERLSDDANRRDSKMKEEDAARAAEARAVEEHWTPLKNPSPTTSARIMDLYRSGVSNLIKRNSMPPIDSNCTFRPNRVSQSAPRVRNFSSLIDRLYSYAGEKENRRAARQAEQEEKLSSEFTFQPTINSRYDGPNSSHASRKLSFGERLHNLARRRKQSEGPMDPAYTFQPVFATSAKSRSRASYNPPSPEMPHHLNNMNSAEINMSEVVSPTHSLGASVCDIPANIQPPQRKYAGTRAASTKTQPSRAVKSKTSPVQSLPRASPVQSRSKVPSPPSRPKPPAKSLAKTPAKSPPKSPAKSPAKSSVKALAKPAVKSAAKPAAKSVAQRAAEPVTEPAAELAVEPTAEPITEPEASPFATAKAVEAPDQSWAQPPVKPASEPKEAATNGAQKTNIELTEVSEDVMNADNSSTETGSSTTPSCESPQQMPSSLEKARKQAFAAVAAVQATSPAASRMPASLAAARERAAAAVAEASKSMVA